MKEKTRTMLRAMQPKPKRRPRKHTSGRMWGTTAMPWWRIFERYPK